MLCDGNGFLTVRELAEFAGVREATVLWWVHSSDGPASEHVYGRIVFRAEAVDAWLAQPSASLAVARESNSMMSSTSLASSRLFADETAVA